MNKFKKVLITNVIVAPFLVVLTTLSIFAQNLPKNDALDDLTGSIGSIGSIVQLLVAVIVTIAFLIFFWKVVVFIFVNQSADDKTKTKEHIGWSLIALLIITSIWGIIGFFRSLIGIEEGEVNSIQIPEVKFQN